MCAFPPGLIPVIPFLPDIAVMIYLQLIQNALSKFSKRSHVTPVLISLHCLAITFRIHLMIVVITFRALYGQPPFVVVL